MRLNDGTQWRGTSSGYIVFENLHDLNSRIDTQFEEIKDDKITLLFENNHSIEMDGRGYYICKLEDYYMLKVEHIGSGYVEHEIRWGKAFKTTLQDIKPMLDALNVEIIEPLKKYKINTDKDYTEDGLNDWLNKLWRLSE